MVQKQKSLGFNAALNVIRRGLEILFPLITYPYALRVLGVETMGKVNYSASIISYFSLIAMLGVTNYAVREGAKIRQDRERFEKFTSQIFTTNMLFTVLSYILLVALLIFADNLRDYRLLLALQSLSIVLHSLSVEWINTVYEDFLLITLRSIATHIIALVFLIVFVKEPTDYYKYVLITVAINLITCLINRWHCRKYTKVHLTASPQIKKHIKPLLIFFASSLAITIYVNLDVTMLGWIKGDYSVGLYSAAAKVYTIIKNMLAGLYIVAVARMSQYAGSEDWLRYKKTSTQILSYLTVLLMPAGVGLTCVAPEVIKLIGGADFSKAAIDLKILGFALIFAIFGGFFTAGINISLGREKITLIATTISAALNFVLNLIFIPWFSHAGAAITTLISEVFVFAFCAFVLPQKSKYIEIKPLVKNIFHSVVGCLAIVVIAILFNYCVANDIVRMAGIVLTGAICYSVVLLAFRDDVIMEIINWISAKTRKKL